MSGQHAFCMTMTKVLPCLCWRDATGHVSISSFWHGVFLERRARFLFRCPPGQRRRSCSDPEVLQAMGLLFENGQVFEDHGGHCACPMSLRWRLNICPTHFCCRCLCAQVKGNEVKQAARLRQEISSVHTLTLQEVIAKAHETDGKMTQDIKMPWGTVRLFGKTVLL
eukprot:3149704-Amphidinium_carterae.1